MLSNVKGQFVKAADLIPRLRSRRNAMAAPTPFKATDNFEHRYEDPKVLRQALIDIGFKDEEIKIQATEARGLSVQLPREITKKEKDVIYQKFVDAKRAKRVPPKTPDDEEDDD